MFHKVLITIKEMLRPDKITLVEFSTRILRVRDITQNTDLRNLKFNGRGGTNIYPVIEWIQENKPEVTLVFTDGGFASCDYPVTTDVIWIIHDNPDFTAPQGKVIHHELNT